jgi:hypothetical protein
MRHASGIHRDNNNNDHQPPHCQVLFAKSLLHPSQQQQQAVGAGR